MFLLVFAVIVACAMLPLSVSALAYAFVEKRHRRAWTSLPLPVLRLGAGPYRAGEIVGGHLARAPMLVRTAGMTCFYWSWFCLVTWAVAGFQVIDRTAGQVLVGTGVLVAVAIGWTGGRLLRRDAAAARLGPRVAMVAAVHGVLVLGLVVTLGGTEWSGLAAIFTGVALAQAALVVAATRRHAALFGAERHGAERPRLPAWLALALSKRTAQRRANRLTSASHTMPGA